MAKTNNAELHKLIFEIYNNPTLYSDLTYVEATLELNKKLGTHLSESLVRRHLQDAGIKKKWSRTHNYDNATPKGLRLSTSVYVLARSIYELYIELGKPPSISLRALAEKKPLPSEE